MEVEGGVAVKGVFMAVVGPSGAGKDSIMRAAASAFTNDDTVHFARRIVTRASNADEDHDSVSKAEFASLVESGALALNWKAHGLSYGLPASIHNKLAIGHMVIANTSRAIAAEIKTIFPKCIIVHITASEDILQQRLMARGREAVTDWKLRIARSNALEHEFATDIKIENNGELEEAVTRFVASVRALKSVASNIDA